MPSMCPSPLSVLSSRSTWPLTPKSPSSLSFKNNASQDLLLGELHRLEASINEALYRSSRPVGGFLGTGPSSGARGGHNLRRLAEAARQVHTATSSTAGTVRGDRSENPWQWYPGADGGEAPWQSYSGGDTSLYGDLSASRRERVEEFLRHQNTELHEPAQPLPTLSSPKPSQHRAPHPISTFAAQMPSHGLIVVDEDDGDAELERLFREGLEQITTVSLQDENYDRAIEYLEEAIAHSVTTGESGDNYVRLQLQLALCYLIVGKWQAAAPLVTKLAKSKARPDLTMCNLLHAVALGYLSTSSFKEALAACRQALKGKKRLVNRGEIEPFEYWETLGLFVAILDATKDTIQAEVFRLELPPSFPYLHPASEVTFVWACPGLLKSVLGIDGVVHGSNHSYELGVELERGGAGHRSAKLLTDKERLGADAHSPNDGDDETSAASSPLPSPLRRRLSRFFGFVRPRSNDGRDRFAGSPRLEAVSESLP